MRRAAWVPVSRQVIEHALHAPSTARIIGVAWDCEHDAVRILFESPDLPEADVLEAGQWPDTDVTITRDEFGYRWSWGRSR